MTSERDTWLDMAESRDNKINDLKAENEKLRKIEQAAHDLICWTYQHAINVEPEDYSRHVKDLHPGVYNSMNSAERELYTALNPQIGNTTPANGER